MADMTAPDIGGQSGGGFLKKLFKGVIFAAILGGGGFGAGLYFAGERLSPSQEVLKLIEKETESQQADAEDQGPKRVPKDIPETPAFQTNYHEFPEALTTNLRDGRRFLQIGIGVSTQYDQTVIDNIVAHEMALRSDMLAVLSGFSENDIQGVEGRETLAAALRDAINKRLEALEGFGGVESVFFPTFMLQ